MAAIRLVPRASIAALLVGPLVWLAYFVASYLIVALGCRLGAEFAALRIALALVSAAALVLIGLAAAQAFRYWKQEKHDSDPTARERRSFIALSALFLCGIALLGTLWGSLNILFFSACF